MTKKERKENHLMQLTAAALQGMIASGEQVFPPDATKEDVAQAVAEAASGLAVAAYAHVQRRIESEEKAK